MAEVAERNEVLGIQIDDGAAWVTAVLRNAVEQNVSDVQFRFLGDIENGRGILVARASVNRRYQVWGQISDAAAAQALGFVKLAADITTGPITRAYFGRWSFDGVEPTVDIRVTATPTIEGETFALRLPTLQKVPLLSTIRMSEWNRNNLMSAIRKPNGMFCLVGPGSSGKSVFVASMLQFIITRNVNAVSVEDPAERRLAGVDQIEINDDAGSGYEEVLESLRRLHMQVLLLGEINKPVAARAAVEIANAGTRVFTTLHANDALGGLEALVELAAASPRTIANSVRVMVSQRLLRETCQACQKNGCTLCDGSGVKGVIPIHQVLVLNDEVIDLFVKGAPRQELEAAAMRAGMRSLWEDADELIAAGRTTEDEAEFEIGPREAGL